MWSGPSSEIGLRGSSMGSARGANARTENAHLRGGEAGVFLLAETLFIPSPYSGETRRIRAQSRKSQRLNRSLSLLLTTKRWTACTRSASFGSWPSDSPRFGCALVGKPKLALEDAAGGNRCVCPV